MAFRAMHEKTVAVAVEPSYGALGTYRALIPCEFKADYKRDAFIKAGVNGARTDVSVYKKEGALSGNISMDATSADLGEIFKAFFGTATVTGAGGTFLHTFTPVGTIADTFASMSAKVNFGQTTVYDYSGIRIDKLTISSAAKENVKVSVDFIGKSEIAGTACPAVIVYSTLSPLTFNQVTYTLNGTVKTPRNFSVELSNSLSEGYRVGTDHNTIRPLPSDKMSGVVKFDLDFEDAIERNNYLLGSYMPLNILVQGELFSGTTKQELHLTMPRIAYQSAPFETFDGLLGLTVSAYVLDGTNVNGTGNIIAKLYNGVAAY